MAHALLDRRVAQEVKAIRKSRAGNWKPPRLDAITVGEWTKTNAVGSPDGLVTFVGYQTVTTRHFGTDDMPLERFTVHMRWEDQRWKLIYWQEHWLTPAGPMADSGKETIKELPEHVVFWNRRSRIPRTQRP